MKHMPRTKFLVGIDEVGRGPFAGPVAVGAVFASPRILRKFAGVRESKQLSAAARESWHARMRSLAKEFPDEFRFAVSFVSAATIDKIGIVPAIRRALATSLRKLNIDPSEAHVLLDGGLRAPAEYADQQTIIKGDEKESVIALASIAAKVLRDRRMTKLAKKYPAYGFARHVGYGTAFHMTALRTHGLTPFHRRSFCRNIC